MHDGRANPKGATRGTRRRRWLRWLLPALPLVALGLLIAFGPYWAMRIEPLRERLLDSATMRELLGERLRLRIGAVERLDLGGFDVRAVELEALDAQETWQTVVTAQRVAASWSPLRQITGTIRVHSLITGPITVQPRALSLLGSTSGADSAGEEGRTRSLLPAQLPRVRIDLLQLGPVTLATEEGEPLSAAIAEASLRIAPDGVDLEAGRAALALPWWGLDLTLTGGDLRVRSQRAELTGWSLAGPRAAGLLEARYEPAADGAPLMVGLIFERLDPAVLTEWLLPEVVPLPGDTARGAAEVRLGAGPTTVELMLRGTLLGETCEECSGVVRVSPDAIAFDDVRLRAQAADLQGEGVYDRPLRRIGVAARWERFDPHSRWLPWLHDLPIGGGFAGACDVDIDLPEKLPAKVTGRLDARGARPWDIATDHLRFRGRWIPGEALDAEQLTVELDGGRLVARGHLPLGAGAYDGEATLDSVPLAALPARWVRGASGRLWGDVHISGVNRDPLLEGNLRGAQMAYGEWSVDYLSAGSLLLWPKDLRGSGTVDLHALRRGRGEPLDASLRLSRWQEWISLAADLRRPTWDVNLEGRVDPQGSAHLDGGSVSLRRLGRWELREPVWVAWRGDTLAADSLHLSSGSATLTVALRYDRNREHLHAGARLQDYRLARLRGVVLGTEHVLEGTCHARLDLAGSLPDPSLSFALTGDSLVVGSVDLGSLELRGDWSAGALELQRGEAASRALTARTEGLRMRSDAPLLDLVGLSSGDDDVPGRPTSASESPWRRAQWEGRIGIERLDLGSWAPLVGLPGPATGGGHEGIEIRRVVGGREVPIRVTAPWEFGSAAMGAGGLGGGFSGELELGGTMVAPELRLTGEVDDLSLAMMPVGALRVDLAYANSLFSLQRLELTEGDHVSEAKGYFPFHLDLMPFSAEPTDWPADLRASLTDLNVGLLSGLTRWIPDAQGRLSGSLTVGGTGVDPLLSGELHLVEGGFRVPGRSERVFDVEARMRLTPEGLSVESLTGRSGPRGTLHADGLLRGPNEFDLTVGVREIRVFEPGAYELEVSADSLRVRSRVDADGVVDPRIEGAVEVLGGTVRPGFTGGEGGRVRGERILWRIEVDVSVPGVVHVSQSNAKVDVGEGDVRVSYRWPHWNASGTLQILGGTYRLFNNNFTILEGVLELRDTGSGVDATVDVVGETYVALTATGPETGLEGDGEQEVPQTVRVEVHVSGPPDALQVDLTSEPPYTPEEIAELLSYGRLTGTGGLRAETQSILFNEMVARIERSLSEQFPLSTTVAIETGGSTGEIWPPRRVRLQQMITPEITGNYAQEIYQGTDWEIYLSYRLSRILYLRAGIAHERVEPRGFNEEYNLDLKLRFDYE